MKASAPVFKCDQGPFSAMIKIKYVPGRVCERLVWWQSVCTLQSLPIVYFVMMQLEWFVTTSVIHDSTKYSNVFNSAGITFRSRKNGSHYTGKIFKHIALKENIKLLIQISLTAQFTITVAGSVSSTRWPTGLSGDLQHNYLFLSCIGMCNICIILLEINILLLPLLQLLLLVMAWHGGGGGQSLMVMIDIQTRGNTAENQ